MRMMRFFIPMIAMLAAATAAMAQSGGTPPDQKGAGNALFSPMGGERPEGAKTEITANEEATFDNEKNIAEFKGRVVVKDSQFTLTCDRLVVNLGKERKGIEEAEAVGNVVIIQELPADKKDTPKAIGRAGVVTYKPDSGEMVLRDFPSIQQGINNHVATEASTVMVLRGNGQSRTFGGGSKTLIVSDTAKAP